MREPTERGEHPCGGEYLIYKFANGYKASVIRMPLSLGYESGLWELGIIRLDAGVSCGITETPISDDGISGGDDEGW